MGARVVAVGPDSAEDFRRTWQALGLSFTGIPDPTGALLDALQQENIWWRLGRMPLVQVLGRNGTVHWAHSGAAMWDLPPVTQILEAAEAAWHEEGERM